MEYKCNYKYIDSLPIGLDGMVTPLCNDCQSVDCTNNIEAHLISILGINKTHRVLVIRNKMAFVLGCEGYIKDGKE